MFYLVVKQVGMGSSEAVWVKKFIAVDSIFASEQSHFTILNKILVWP